MSKAFLLQMSLLYRQKASTAMLRIKAMSISVQAELEFRLIFKTGSRQGDVPFEHVDLGYRHDNNIHHLKK